jgi:glycosyltransferase involved in cell wall biosynthesis
MNTPRRILMTTDAVGGVWRYAVDAARGLADRGIETVLVGQGPQPVRGQIQELKTLPGVSVEWLSETLDWLADGPTDIAAVSARLAEIAAARDVDLLHLNMPSQAAGLRTDLPVIVTSHSCVVTWWQAVRSPAPLPQAWLWLFQINRAGLARADVVVTPSRSHGKALVRAYGPMRDLRMIANATADLGALPKEPFALSAARWWDEGKNGAVLDQAAALTAWPVLAAGALDGPTGQSFAFRHARALGDMPAHDMRDLMSRAAVFVGPSLYEPFGLAVLEAAASGAALVLADIPTFRELWTDAAVFFDPHDPAMCAFLVDTLAADDGQRAKRARLARERATAFTFARQAESLHRLYDDVLRAGEGRQVSVA